MNANGVRRESEFLRWRALMTLVAGPTALPKHRMAVQADLGDRDGIKLLFDAVEQVFGGIDVIVNNAGVMPLNPIAHVSDDESDHLVRLNLGGVFRGMREGARRLRDGGRIISFSSSVIGLYPPNYGVYGATKAGVEAMTHILAKELGPRRISVNAIAPDPVETELFTKEKTDAQIEAIAKMNPFGRIGQPKDIASVVSFLAGPDGGWVNGQTVRANGGVI
jgi:3-oxoacyl-[acyl-carrier protein] reductase